MSAEQPCPGEVRARLAHGSAWGTYGSAADPYRYVKLLPGRFRNRRRSPCGCGGKASHVGMSNGLAMTSGCEMSMRRWMKTEHRLPPPFDQPSGAPRQRPRRLRAVPAGRVPAGGNQ